MDKDIVLTVIVPVFNSAKYFRNCIDSLVQQDLDNDSYEVLLINDGSTDSSLDIIKSYSEKYDFIRYIDKSNDGISVARNIGIDNALGKYITFVDSDDAIATNVLGKAISITSTFNLPVLTFSYECYHDDAYIPLSDIKIEKETIILNKISINIAPFQVWGIIYEKDSIKNSRVRFNESFRTREDHIFNLLLYASLVDRKIGNLNIPIYKYRVRSGSLSHIMNYKSNSFQVERRQDMIQYVNECLRFLSGSRGVSDCNTNNQVLYIARFYAMTALLAALRCKDSKAKSTKKILQSKGVLPIKITTIRIKDFVKYLLTQTCIFSILDRFDLLRKHTIE